MLTSPEITSALDSADLGRSLLVLRSFRETFLKQLKEDLYGSSAMDRLLEDIANQTESSNSSYRKIIHKLDSDERYQTCAPSIVCAAASLGWSAKPFTFTCLPTSKQPDLCYSRNLN